MGTRSRIGLVAANGKVKSIYCHWDGYPTGVGKKLLDNYSDPASVKALLALGSISSLQENLAPEPGTTHQFGDAQDGVTVAYHRDRGEPKVISKADNADDMYREACEGWEEYAYLYRDGQWYCTEVGGGAGPFLVTASDPEGVRPPDWKLVSELVYPKVRKRPRALVLT